MREPAKQLCILIGLFCGNNRVVLERTRALRSDVPRKNSHTPAEVSALADRLRASRPEGMAVESWLAQKHAELRSMIRGSRSWSWEQIAAALNMAGITYQAGVARADGHVSRGRWTALQLQNKVRTIRERDLARRPTVSASDADAMASVIEALVRRGVLAVPHGTEAASSDPAAHRDAIRQLAVSPPLASPELSQRQTPGTPAHEVSETTLPEPGQHGPLAQAVADQAAHDDRGLAAIRERRRRRTTGSASSDQERSIQGGRHDQEG